MPENRKMYFGKTLGVNSFSGDNLVVISTLHRPELVYIILPLLYHISALNASAEQFAPAKTFQLFAVEKGVFNSYRERKENSKMEKKNSEITLKSWHKLPRTQSAELPVRKGV